jgi:multiple sugar transport system substrate-binding protein
VSTCGARARRVGGSAAAFVLVLAASVAGSACRSSDDVLTISGSSVGGEAELLRRQLDRFMAAHPGQRVVLRPTPDASDVRHQLYAQWLNAHATEPDVLQLDVVWTAEFAAAGWLASLDRFGADPSEFFAGSVAAHRWRGTLYALPWFTDVGLLYWRTDLMPGPPRDQDELVVAARRAREAGEVPFGLVWQGARYEGLVTVFLEYLGAHGGVILDAAGRVRVADAPAVRALAAMVDAVREGTVPMAALGWQEEQTRFAFQNGQAAFMRNWPYARPLLDDARQSAVAGRFAVAAFPAAEGGVSTAALGGSALAVNAFSRQPDEAFALIDFLLAPDQMMERARVTGQYPPRRSLYDEPALSDALRADAAALRAILERAQPRPVTPVYAELSEILQVSLHRALSGQQAPGAALTEAAHAMQALLTRTGLAPAAS